MGVLCPCPTAMTLLGLFPAYPPYPAESSTLPRVPSQESPATGWARSCPGDATPSARPSSAPALPRGTPPCDAPGHLPALAFGVTPGQARALHPPIGVSPRPGTLAHPPGREGGSESSRAGQSTQCHEAPRGGSTHPEARWKRWGGHREAEGRGLGRCAWGSDGCCAGGSGCCAGWGIVSAAEVGVLRTGAGGGH